MPKVFLTTKEKEMPINSQLDSMLRRFKKQVEKAQIIDDYKKHTYFLKKSIRRKEKSKRAQIFRNRMKRKK